MVSQLHALSESKSRWRMHSNILIIYLERITNTVARVLQEKGFLAAEQQHIFRLFRSFCGKMYLMGWLSRSGTEHAHPRDWTVSSRSAFLDSRMYQGLYLFWSCYKNSCFGLVYSEKMRRCFFGGVFFDENVLRFKAKGKGAGKTACTEVWLSH